MGGKIQKHFLHKVFPRHSEKAPRYNSTFRTVVNHTPQCSMHKSIFIGDRHDDHYDGDGDDAMDGDGDDTFSHHKERLFGPCASSSSY